MERIVVTGGHGMPGRHLVAALEPDYHVTVVDRVDGGSHQSCCAAKSGDLECRRTPPGDGSHAPVPQDDGDP